MLKRFSRIALAIILAVSMMTIAAPISHADEEQIVVSGEGFQFTLWLDEGQVGSVALSGYTGTDTEVKLPTAIQYKGQIFPIEQIGWNAFEGNQVMEKVIIPDGYYSIGKESFKDCTNLQTIIMGQGGEGFYSIGENAFAGCGDLKEYRIGEASSGSGDTPYYDPKIGQDAEGTVYPGVTVYVPAGGNLEAYLNSVNERSIENGGANANQITINTSTGSPVTGTDYTKVVVIDGSADPTQEYGTDGTPYGPGASEEAVEAAIEKLQSETDPKGSVFYKLCVKASKVANTSITLKWNKPSGAAKYVIYASKCGKTDSCKRLAETTKLTYKVTKVKGAKLAKGKYYKFIVVALDKNRKVITTSTIIHVGTTGGKICNIKSVTTKAKKNKVTVKKGKSFALKGKMVKNSSKLKLNVHRVIKYVSTNPKVATVSSKGVIKGKKKGTCSVYAYAQNGVYKKIKVTVK